MVTIFKSRFKILAVSIDCKVTLDGFTPFHDSEVILEVSRSKPRAISVRGVMLPRCGGS
jgi:hypothetical protein